MLNGVRLLSAPERVTQRVAWAASLGQVNREQTASRGFQESAIPAGAVLGAF